MPNNKKTQITLLFLFLYIFGFGQEFKTFNTLMDSLYHLAEEEKFGQIIEVIDKNEEYYSSLKEQYILKTYKAEILRITRDFEMAAQTLWSIPPYNNDSNLLNYELNKIGRLAAVFHECNHCDRNPNVDSTFILMDSVLRIIKKHPGKFLRIEASISNELGFYMGRQLKPDLCRYYLKRSTSIYEGLNDSLHMIGPLTNWLELEFNSKNFTISDSLVKVLEGLLQNRTNYSAMIEAQRRITTYYYAMGDSLNFYKSDQKTLFYSLQSEREQYSNTMQSLRETQERKQIENDLITEKKDKKQLFFYFILALSILLITLFFGFRNTLLKRKISKKNQELALANDNYQMLMIESNHRIKNNLQMISAMLDYTKSNSEEENTKTIDSISGKVNTISALHKILHLKSHDIDVNLEEYFKEIITLYSGMSIEGFNVDLQIEPITISSKKVVYFGLIFNELLSNTIEHSFDKINRIKIVIQKSNSNQYSFMYSDMGNWESNSRNEGTGITLIRGLIGRLKGKDLSINRKEGEISFLFNT